MSWIRQATQIDIALTLLQLVALTLPVVMILLQVLFQFSEVDRIRGFMNPERLKVIGIKRSLISGILLVVSAMVLGIFLGLSILDGVFVPEILVFAVVLQLIGFLALLWMFYSVFSLSTELI